MNKRQLLLSGAAATLLSKLGVSWAQAGAYPNRAIHLIVPSEAGGGTDFTARTIGLKLTELLGQSLVVDNRPGAAGNIGVEQGARAAPDGYTLVMPITSLPMSPWLYPKLPYDPVKDFVPIILACAAPLIMVVNPELPAKTVQEFITLAKNQPDKLNYANSGNGTTAHLAGELFKKMADIKMQSVNYKGGGSSVIDTVAGRVQMYFSTIPAVSARSGEASSIMTNSLSEPPLSSNDGNSNLLMVSSTAGLRLYMEVTIDISVATIHPSFCKRSFILLSICFRKSWNTNKTSLRCQWV